MKPPRLLLGAALLFWGWQTGLFWFGLGAALAVESSHLIAARWEFSQSDLDRVWNLCVALFLGATIFAFFSSENLNAVGDLLRENSPSSRLATLNQSKRSLFQLLQWLPLMFLPTLLAQVYGEQERLDLSTFSWWLRRQRTAPDYATRYAQGMNVGYPYFACCLFAASAANQRTAWFTAGLLALAVWPLWLHRAGSYGRVAWASSLLLALTLGLGIHVGMLEVQKLIQRLDEILLAHWSGSRSTDAKENQTRLGSIGRLKLSGRIVLRVDPHGQAPPPFLREASYNLFQSPLWMASKQEPVHLASAGNQATWILHPAQGPSRVVTIAGALPGGSGLLALPNGVLRIEHLPVQDLQTNSFGAVQVDDGPGFVEFLTTYGDTSSIDGPVLPADRDLAAADRAAVLQIAAELNLEHLAPAAALRAVEGFFAEHFTYSTWQAPPAGRPHSPLARFLLQTRSGHCEYFATATTLLLRAAHIPARYAVGYAVRERQGRYYVVRERHAHAWCLAFLDGSWRDIDTTPADWTAIENERASVWQPVRDFFSWLWFQFSRWRWGHAEWKGYLLWLIVPLLALALGKVLLQRQWSRSKSRKAGPHAGPQWPGLDSEFYGVERQLARAGLGRLPGETGLAWVERLRRAGIVPVDALPSLLLAHYRLRFDPGGLDPESRLRLRQQSEAWLSRWHARERVDDRRGPGRGPSD